MLNGPDVCLRSISLRIASVTFCSLFRADKRFFGLVSVDEPQNPVLKPWIKPLNIYLQKSWSGKFKDKARIASIFTGEETCSGNGFCLICPWPKAS